jgi:hypothetical protein
MTDDNKPRDEWDAMAEVTRRPVCAHAERFHAHLDAVAAERAAVVAWLRSLQPHNTEVVAVYLQMLADVIERGGHRREENE